MSLASFTSSSFLNLSGDAYIGVNALVEVRKESDNSLASIFADVNGVTPLANPFASDADGMFTLYTTGSARGFKVTVTSGSTIRILRNVAIGTAAEFDVGDIIGALLASSTAAAFLAGLGGASIVYVDAALAGLDAKVSCKLSTVANDTLSGLAARDGITPIAGDRVFVPVQTAPAQNGIYIAASGAWTRATDMDSWLEVPSAAVYVETGTVNGDTGWLCNADQGGTLGTTAITFVQTYGLNFYQPKDATLTAFAALTIAADSLTIGTGVDAFSQVTFAANKFPAKSSAGGLVAKDLTDFALTLLDDTTQAAMRTTLALTPGTDVQAFDATLAAFAALTIAADSLTIGTGVDAFSQVTFAANKFPAKSSAGGLVAKDLTDFALTILDDTTAPIARTTLGIVEVMIIACSDETTALTSGAKVTFRMPYAFTLSSVRASLTTAQTSGTLLQIDITESATTIFSTKPTLDNTEKTTQTAATASVLSDTSLADDAEIVISISAIGDGTAKGLKVYLLGTKTA